MQRLKVLFIGGSGRSGSTLLDSILGQLDGFVSVGELNEVWRAGFGENRLCGCGRAFRDCAFWASAVEAGVGALGEAEIRGILRLQRRVCRLRTIPRMALPWLRSSDYRRALAAYCGWYRRLLDGISGQAGARIVVDSSKSPAHGYLLSSLGGLELHVVQLVRDSRAVAHSWRRMKRVPRSNNTSTLMVRMAPWRSALDWNLRHLLLASLRRRRHESLGSFRVVRYEDFVAQPEETLSRIVEPLDPSADIRGLFAAPSTVTRRRPTHGIEGNPSKFDEGNIEIRLDDEWSRTMRPLDRAIVLMLTAPYLREFGYV